MRATVLTSIPSPSSNAIHIGPLQLRAYGLMIALGVIAAVWLAGRRLEERRAGTKEDMSGIAMWAVPAGVVGARLYHVLTDWKSFQGDWLRAFKIWQGGLGIWGGIALGAVVGLWAARRRGISTAAGLVAAAPALPLAQAIGRLGNWWNQELFGRPTTLPWGLEIDPPYRPAIYADALTFHPTFLYEALWNLALCGFLLWYDRKRDVAAGKLFALYVAGYTLVRFFIERLRVDHAYQVAGLRVNEWVSAIGFVIAVVYLVRHRRDTWVPLASARTGAADVDVGGEGVDTDVADDADADELLPAALVEDDLGGEQVSAGDLGLDEGDAVDD